MTVEELIARLREYPSDACIWNFNEGLPTPVSGVEEFFQAMPTSRKNVILS